MVRASQILPKLERGECVVSYVTRSPPREGGGGGRRLFSILYFSSEFDVSIELWPYSSFNGEGDNVLEAIYYGSTNNKTKHKEVGSSCCSSRFLTIPS